MGQTGAGPSPLGRRSLSALDRLPPLAQLKSAAIALHPELGGQRFRVNDEGWSNRILEAESGMLLRFPRSAEAARRLGFEARLLSYLALRVTVPVPVPLRMGTLPGAGRCPFLSYRKLPGVALGRLVPLGRASRFRVSALLGRLLPELAAIPPPSARRIGCRAGDPGTWVSRYTAMFAHYRRVGSPTLPSRLDRAIRAEFDRGIELLTSARFVPVLSHLDLGPYNIIWDPSRGEPSGVIDWEDARLADPAFDLVGLGCVGEAAWRRLALARCAPADGSFRERIAFYRRVIPVQEMVYGLEAGRLALVRERRRQLAATYGLR